MNTIARIAIFRALYLGDMLCIIPSVRAIRMAYPTAEIFLIGLPWQKEFALRFNHYFDHFIEFPGWPGLPEQEPDTQKILSFLMDVRTYRFDLIFQMQGNGLLTNAMCMLWGGKIVSGLRKTGEYAPDKRFFPESDDSEHEVLRFLKLPDSLGLPHQGTDLEFPITEKERTRFKNILEQTEMRAQRYICIHPGARDRRRRWPVENFAIIANHIAVHGYTIVLTGSIEEKALLEELQQRIKAPVINIVETFGHLNTGELASVLKNTRLLISNDTGVSHIAAALKVPSIILFSGFSNYNRWRPLDTEKHIAIPFERTRNPEEVIHYVNTWLEEPLSLKQKNESTGALNR